MMIIIITTKIIKEKQNKLKGNGGTLFHLPSSQTPTTPIPSSHLSPSPHPTPLCSPPKTLTLALLPHFFSPVPWTPKTLTPSATHTHTHTHTHRERERERASWSRVAQAGSERSVTTILAAMPATRLDQAQQAVAKVWRRGRVKQ